MEIASLLRSPASVLSAAACLLAAVVPVCGQEAGDNVRFGDLRLNFRGTLTQSYNSNIGLSSDNAQADWITGVGLRSSGELELTEINHVRLSVGLEYRKYWQNPQFDSNRNVLNLTPESGLELFFLIGNFDIRLYDDFSLLSDPGDQRFIDPSSGAQIGNIVLYNRIRNRLGLDAIWTINPYWNANAGISRLDITPLDSEFRSLQRHSYLASAGLTHNLAANLDIYGQVSASIDEWREDFQPDSASNSFGLGANWQPRELFETKVFLAWTQRTFDNNGNNLDPTRESSGLTGNIELTHTINAELQHALRYSRSIDLGSVSNEIATQSVDYRIDYAGFERSKLYLGVFWNEGVESGAFNPESYDRWAFQTGFGYPLSRKLEFLVELEHSLRESSLAGRSFDRNLVSLKLTYDF